MSTVLYNDSNGHTSQRIHIYSNLPQITLPHDAMCYECIHVYSNLLRIALSHDASYTYLPQFTANLVTAISCNVHIFTMICSTPHDHAMQHAHVHSDVQRIMLPCNATCAHLLQSAARFYLKSILPWSQVSCVRAMRRVMGMQEGNRKGDGAVGR